VPRPLEQPRFDPHELVAERVSHLYRHRKSAWVMQAVGAGLMALVLSTVLPLVALGWLGFFALAHGAQWLVGRKGANEARLRVSFMSLWPHRLAALAVGGTWGLAGATLPQLPADRGVMVLVLIVIAVAMNLPRLAAMPDVFLSFVVGAMLPTALAAGFLPREQGHLVWGVVVLVSLLLWVSSRSVEADLTDVLVKRLDLERIAWEDKLTGLPNRRRFDEHLLEEWRRAGRLQVPLTMLMIDIDHFKRFNDSYGHVAGDACLTMVGNAVSRSVRRTVDFAARYAGEEFAVMLFHTTRADGLQFAERLRKAVADLEIEHGTSEHRIVTISVGGVTVVPQRHEAPEVMINLADEALYNAKAAGRNKVVWHSRLV
jgi:diguanylate cyclase (GGDEF)-like protein